MAKKAKRKVNRRSRQAKETPQSPFSGALNDLSRMAEAVASRPTPKLNKTQDARSMVLGACAGVLSDVTTAINNLAAATVQAPNYTDTESRE